MKGYGLTVMKGDVPERFEVEVLGVIPNSLGRARILVKVSGLGLEKTGVIAGMSGSPVYFDGKLAGAVSATWAFPKEPIGQVTPIEAMLDIDAAPLAPTARATASTRDAWEAFAAARGLGDEERVAALTRLAAPYRPAPGREAAPLLAPVSSGISASTFALFADDLARLGFPAPFLAASGTSGGRAPGPSPGLVPGGALTAFLLDGDLQLGATGTVTRIDPDGRFLAFGHPFLGIGALDVPVSASQVVDVFPSSMMSFKVAAPYEAAYRLTRDRDPGIAGRTDRTAPLVPVHFRLETPGQAPRDLHWGAASLPALFPILLAMSTDTALLLNDPTPTLRTASLRISIATKAGPFVYEDLLSGSRARDLVLLSTVALAGLVVNNEFEDAEVSGVDIAISSEPGERRLRLVDAGVQPRRVAPGEKVAVTVRLAGRRGEQETRVVTLTVPRQAPEGRATLVVADGAAASAARLALDPAPPRSLEGLRRSIEKLLPANRLVATLVVPTRGIATGGATLTALPPSAAAVLADAVDGDATRANITSRLLAEEILTLDQPMTGTIRLDVEIERPRS